MNPIFHGKIQNSGKFPLDGRYVILDKPSEFNRHLQTLAGQRIEVIVRKERSNRSNNQNSYYHAVVIEILSDFTGYSHDEMHEALKFMFLRTGGEGKFEYVKSTAKLNTAEFEEYLDKIRNWAGAILNCNIPLPNEVE